MKNQFHFQKNRLLLKVLLSGIISCGALGFINVYAQVNFSQTLTADFNKGVLNNTVAASDNLYLQFAASDVGTWLTTTVLPQTLAGHKTVSWNDRYVYLVGGYNNLNYVNTVYRATIQGGGVDSWTALTPLPVALRDPAVVIGTNTIYVMGGRDGSQVYNTIYYATLSADGSIGAWQTSPVTLPVNLWGHTATYMMGCIYVIGGSSSMTENTALPNVYVARVNALNTLSAFTSGTSLPVARNRHSTVTYNNKLFVLGGYDDSGIKSNSVYIAVPGLDGSTGSWSSGTSLPEPVSNHSSVVTNGVIAVMAGAVGATLSNVVYYSNAESLSWQTSPNVMYDYTKDGSAFQGNGIIFYTGGTNLSGGPILNCRYALMTQTTNYVAHGIFVSCPFYELGAERLIDSLSFFMTSTAPAAMQVNYRIAGSDGIWSNWTPQVSASPIIVNQTKQYLQYAVMLTGSTTFNSTLNEMRLTTPGTQLTGNLDGISTFTKALSPYWATADISLTSGTHTFEHGTTILFLPGTGLTVSAANVKCNGIAGDSVKFTYFTNETGNWDGILFDDASDAGVSSQFYYTVIANAGYGSNNANLFCNLSDEPLLSNCNIRNADGNGIRLNSAHINIQNSRIRANSENGLFLNNSNPTLVNCSMSYNGGAGVYYTSTASVPNFSSSGTVIDHNLYAFRYPSPNFTFYQPIGSPTLTANTYNGISIDGGDISSSQRWNSITYDYILLGSVQVGLFSGANRLTIEPGNTIKGVAGVQIQIGVGNSFGGELYALGTADSMITFTSHNGLPGGWNGIYFSDWSDNWGGQSQMDYCILEKGNDYNYYSVSTAQPNLINHSIIRNSLQDGARYNNSAGNITNCQFLNNGRYPVYFLNPEANPTHTGNTYTGNVINRFALSGGSYPFNRTYNNDGVTYLVLDNLIMAQFAGSSKLTIDPGVIMEFAAGKKLQLGAGNSFGGELNAIGTAVSPIIFKASSLLPGGWEGIHFTPWNDDWGGTSVMEYCTVKHGASQNILIEGSAQPSMNHCTINFSALHGIVLSQSSPSIKNCLFTQNAGYPLKFNDWICNAYLRGNTYTSNTMNYIALSGGNYEANRTVYFDNVPYHVLGDINMAQFSGHSRLIIQPGVTMAFNPGVKLQLGVPNSFGGDLWAEGKVDSTITFKPYNNLAGGWAGIYFSPWNDAWGGTSLLKYCVIEKGASYNINCVNTGQPALDHSILRYSTGNGLVINNSSLTIRNSCFIYNSSNGIYLDGTGTCTLGNTEEFTCNLYNNGLYELYNNSTADLNARYNYWGTGDSTMIALRIFDKSDNSAKGRVSFVPFAQVPSLFTTNTLLSGSVKYANSAASPMQNAMMSVKNFSNTVIGTATTNSSGIFNFPSIASGNYKMTITPADTGRGCNSTDALAILNHFALVMPLTGMKLAAADVNYSHTVNGADALLVLKRFTGQITTFPAGDYLYHSDTVIVNGSNVSNDLLMLHFGDVNASYIPGTKSPASVGLVYEGSLVVESFSEFDFPVKLKTAMQLGAISLGFYYPAQFLEITDARLANGFTGFSWTAVNGLFRMAWCDMNALNITGDEIVVILRMKTRDLSGLNGSIALDLYEDCEFADGSATPNAWEVVSVPTINTTLTGVRPNNNLSRLSVYPNPVTEKSVIEFTLKNAVNLRVSLLNVVGTPVMDIVSGDFSAGSHKVALKASNLNSGVYLLKIVNTSNGQTYSGMIKLVVSY